MSGVVLWLFIFASCIIFELLSPGFFYFLSLAFGALIASFVSAYGFNLSYQLISLSITTVISLILLKKWVNRTSANTLHMTNIYALVGKQGTVVKSVSPQEKGWVSLHNQLWSAYSYDETTLSPNTKIVVVRTSGSHLVVKKVD